MSEGKLIYNYVSKVSKWKWRFKIPYLITKQGSYLGGDIYVLSGLASRGDYLIPRSYTATKQNRAFSAAGPSIWNGLPFELRSLPHDFSSSF